MKYDYYDNICLRCPSSNHHIITFAAGYFFFHLHPGFSRTTLLKLDWASWSEINFDPELWVSGWTKGLPEITSNLNYSLILYHTAGRPEKGLNNLECIWNFRYVGNETADSITVFAKKGKKKNTHNSKREETDWSVLRREKYVGEILWSTELCLNYIVL